VHVRAVAVAGAAALLVPGLLLTSGTPAASAASGRCTITGTAHADHLVGTGHADVICGLGGNDTIDGRGGNDVVRGGTGSDALSGSLGADTLVGGSGADKLYGGAGSDEISGGLNGDVATGGGGADDLAGGAGNDDLTGGAGSDDLDGGTGTNWCSRDASDTEHHCVYDRQPPAADSTTVSASTVEVSNGAQQVTVRVHLTDDTGLDYAYVGHAEGDPDSFPTASLSLQSGDRRDGWWQGTLTFNRWIEPGTFHLVVGATDRIQRHSSTPVADPTIEVVDANPDLEQPDAHLLSPTPTDVFDVRQDGVDLTIRARLSDALSGVDSASACAHEPLRNGAEIYATCTPLKLRSGDRHDGVWSGVVTIERNQTGGDWNVEVGVTDRAHTSGDHSVSYWGPDEYASISEPDPTYDRPLPDGMGRFTVLGSQRTDTVPPTVSAVSATPTHVDTLSSDALVKVTVKASDAGTGLGGVNVTLLPAVEDPNDPPNPEDALELTSGTIHDGTWTRSLRILRGTPPQTYYLKVITWDRADNWHTYVSSGYPDAEVYDLLPTNPTVTIDDTTP
jgi:hypothetical protein